jgi:cobyrinic acid a,c-diamide synthase
MPASAIVVAGTGSGVGKTSITLGLIEALRRRGLTVQPFKVGPDFIDPLHHSQASGRMSRNLDGWMLEPEVNRDRFAAAAAGADIALVEGVMGLFDGSEGGSDRGSTAEMAKLLDLPVVLVVDAAAMARSAAAVIHGFCTFDPDLRVAGVILNNVGGDAHADLIRAAVGGSVPILGALPRLDDVIVPERHLGLHLPHEARVGYTERLGDAVERHVELDALLGEAAAGPTLVTVAKGGAAAAVTPGEPVARIAVARDEAFCFYYVDNLELLRQAGAELVEFSPIRDPLPRDVDGLYVGGGYPELYAAELAANGEARTAVRALARSGAPIYGECGGLMYLARSLEVSGTTYEMCGVVPFATRIPAGLSIGYVAIDRVGGPFGPLPARGHVFHHSAATGPEPYDGGNVLAGYTHLHFASNPRLAAAFVDSARLRGSISTGG